MILLFSIRGKVAIECQAVACVMRGIHAQIFWQAKDKIDLQMDKNQNPHLAVAPARRAAGW